MFYSARIKLTVFYLIILITVSSFFSLAFYHASVREIDRIIERTKFEHSRLFELPPKTLNRPKPPTVEELMDYKNRLRTVLLFVNALVITTSGLAAYFLAGKTLKLIQAMVSKQDQFISDASHELRTPLSVMQAEIEAALLEPKLTKNNTRKIFQSSLEELDRLKTLTNSLLILTKTNKIQKQEFQEYFKLSLVTNSAIKKLSYLAKRKKIKIVTNYQEVTLIGNRSLLVEVMLILLDNAIKYSPTGGKIKIETKRAKHKILIKVIDMGIGIANIDLPHIFDRFYRADKSRSQTNGFGLGLSIAKKIIEVHQGTIAVESEVNKGSTFVIELPVFLKKKLRNTG